MQIKPQPITDRFTCYSESDRIADAFFEQAKRGAPFEETGGVLLHELPPFLQRLVYQAAHDKRDHQQKLSQAWQEGYEAGSEDEGRGVAVDELAQNPYLKP